MYRRSLTSLKVALAGCFALGGVLPFATVPNTPVAKAAAMAFGYEEGASRMATYQQADGSSAYALSLQAQLPASQNAQSQVMILVDTSASQKGLFQEDSLAVAKSILEGLNPEDKVQLVAVDLDAIAMNQGFIAPQSQAMEAALENLSKRTPLGTTDIERVFNWASEQFAAVPNTQPKHLIYIGDGICNASMLGSNRFDKMVANLQERRLPVSSFAIGPERNIEVLSILANQTGGNILIDSDESGAQDLAASDLVNSVRTNVFWPTDIDSSGQINETFPAAAVPLRADRDSILLGTLNSDSAFKLTMQGEVNGEKVTQQWSVQPQASDEQFAFLGYVIDQARKDQGLRLPTVGSEGLREMARIVNVANKSLYSLAGDALRDGNSNAARTLVTAAVKRDPTDPRASEFRSILQEEDAPADDFATAENAGGDQLIGQTDMLQKAYAQQLSTFVRNEIRMANRQMSVNPESVVTRLKEVMNQVQAAADAPQDIRTNLVNSLDVALSTAQGQLVEYRDLEEQRAKAEATAANRMETLASMEDQQKKVVRMVDQFQGLLNDIDYTRDFKEFSVIADNIKESAQLLDETYPNTPIAASVRSNSHTQSVFQSGKIRRQKFLDMVYALDSVEESGVPFDDRNPIRYPDAEEWHEKKLLRKKYERVALLEEGGNEQQILAALERTYDLPPANGIPLSEFVEQLRDAYGINIRIDNRALEEESVDPDEPVEFNLSGIRLSSALKIILDEMNLTYQVRDEVLTITTTTDAEEKQVTLVYDVADLVLPLYSIGGGGGGLGGGGGGFGGGGGGFGGAGGGGLGGGGLGGGGLGGGGGGLFNVTDDEVEAKQDEAVQPIQIESTGNLKEDWNRHFANNYEEPQRILVTVKELMSRPQLAKAEFEQLSAILEAAIRNDQAQPWMYQGLFVAQSGLGAPKAETERLMMSILDNDSSPVTALNVATFMANNGMEARSLTILRDLVDAQPVWAKPLEVAIKAVKAERNTADIQWVTTAILSQAWPDNPTIVKDALLLARATISELKKSGQTTEAAGFERQLVDSLERDCLVRVSWTGDADLDLVVEEPNGTVCSHIQPRTMGGGVMMQDAFAGFDNGKGKVYSEYYVLPKGFSGDYRVYIRNVTGKLAGGKATVEIFRNFRSDNQTSQAKEVEFGDNDVYAINFKLEEGRRTDETDSLLTAVGSELLAAERNAIMDKVEDQFGPYQGSTGNTGSSEGSRVARNRNRGINRRGVGYQPQITSIPSGPSWSGLAFTSYDRMYVFVNGAPNFIEVVDVDTFTFAGTGNNGGGGGLGGGLGGGGLGGGLGGGGLGGGGGGLGGGLF